ncbi:strictosidine synthase [Variovorax sp. dw_954]|uniref:strictosidine synthase n=1 Tax=Variovorax sp. dw_954 TaxID=2720078 RepID=UPI001BD23152|nr:strictosidine synthase [Variovorax sp. dw_954]
MRGALGGFVDRVLGRGSAAITVPVMDGALKPNRVLDNAQVVAELEGIDDLATDGFRLYATAGPVLYGLEGGSLVEMLRMEAEITALAVHENGAVALAVGGKGMRVMSRGRTGWGERARLEQVSGVPLRGVNALCFDESGENILLSDGSAEHAPADWCRDLMEKGHSGRVVRWGSGGQAELLVSGLEHAFGVLPLDGEVIFSESWRHRVMRAGGAAGARPAPMLSDLPGYPSRMAHAAAGGFWLTCFVCRTQLVEFILREDAYRKRMLQEIEPSLWVAPALRSGASFLEPLQGAGVKQMGVLKPWAPPRSYGLVLHVDAAGRTTRSLHSQVDGRHHGITAVAEYHGALYAASKGAGRLLRVPFDAMEEAA